MNGGYAINRAGVTVTVPSAIERLNLMVDHEKTPTLRAEPMPSAKDVDITSSAFRSDPYPFYARWRAEESVYRTTLPDKQVAWLVTRYDDVLTVLKDDRFAKDKTKALTSDQLAKLPWTPSIFKPLERNMLDLDEPDHARLRGLVHQAFTPRLVDNMRQRVQALTDELLDRVEAKGRLDLIHDYALPLPATIIAEILGVPVRDQHRFHRWSNAMLSAMPSTWGRLKVIPHVMAMLRYIRKLIKTRQANPGDDLLSALVQAHEAGDRLSDDELVSMIVLLLVAGHETTVNLIGNGVVALLAHPEQMDRLRNDPALIKPAVEELLRYDSPVQMATERYTREDVTLAGATIPRGQLVFAVIASANRDERQFDRPDDLDITREPNRHLAFGHGVHYCIGASLARLEGQIALNTLIRRAPALRLADKPQALRRRPSLILRGLESLPVTFSRRRVPVFQTAE
jgi:cytochrome P450